ncbi:MAG TPA: MFS transporter [Candidatus Melainabacteria bacterium]|nr:MFS transporter [Candidatus Melainabacteria bacterium]
MIAARSMWSPLSEPIYRALWIAAVLSNVGSFMQEVGSAWLMTSIAPDPLKVALLQTAAYLPFFILAIPSGAFADVVDKRKLLIIGQLWMLGSSLTLGVLSIYGLVNAWVLLALTFMLAVGGAITGPAWNAAIPELVPKEKLEPAIALGGVGYNAARGVGSALGGLAVAALGPGPVFILNAVSFVGVLIVFFNWKPAVKPPSRHKERMVGAVRAGFRFVRHSPALKSVLVRSGSYGACTSAMWALLPLIARQELHLDSLGYGTLLAIFGVGTLIGAAILPRLRSVISLDQVTGFGKILFAGALLGLAYAQNLVTASLFMVGAGVSWIIVNSMFSMGAQKASPAWVRARALAFHILVFLGTFAITSAIWGQIAQYTGLDIPLLAAAALLVVSIFLCRPFPLGIAEMIDTTMSDHWSDPKLVHEPHPNHGPVLITVEYIIDPSKLSEFTEAMSALSTQRRRDGAFQWHLVCDVANPQKQLELFLVESWAEHMRQHERVTVSDRLVEDKVNSFHVGANPIIVRHFINSYLPAELLKKIAVEESELV